MNTENILVRKWNDIVIVKIDSVLDVVNNESFAGWLYGQTLPYVDGDENPTGWAYSWDYERFINRKGIID